MMRGQAPGRAPPLVQEDRVCGSVWSSARRPQSEAGALSEGKQQLEEPLVAALSPVVSRV